jgi:amino acid adenylation domain-containing protein
LSRVLDSYELSPLQAGLLFQALRETDPATYVEQIVVTLNEEVDVARLLSAWEHLVDRHAILRTRFRWQGLAQPVQEVIDGARMPVERFECRAGLGLLIEEQRARGFDLGEAPLMRLALVRNAQSGTTMVWTLHHLLLDGYGRAMLLQELFARYEGCDAEPARPRPYRDYIEWLRGLDKERARRFWQRTLAGFAAPTPLAVSQNREIAAPEYAVHESRLPAALTAALRKRARASRVTLNVLLQAAWALLLHRYSGEPDVVFGVTRACRASALEGAARIVGPLINTVPLRMRIDPEAELGAWLAAQREPQLALREHEHTPLVDVQGWSEVPRGTPLFETLFVFGTRTLDAQLRALGGAWSTRGFRNVGNTHYPLTLAAYGDEELLLELQYSRRRFAEDCVQRMAGHLQALLEGMAGDPKRKLRELPLLTTEEREQVVFVWNKTEAAYPPARCVHELVAEQARLRPDALAAEDGARRLTYRELDERAARLAARLRKGGTQPGALVAVHLARSVDMLVALLAVWKAGAAYVPIDPEYPAGRVRLMLEDSGASALLTAKDLAHLEFEEPLGESKGDPAERLAYVIYTSGSTGVPKGVPITHAGLFNLICWHREAYGVGPNDRATQLAGPAFDAAVWEIWPYLAAGASVHVPDEATRLDAGRLVRWLIGRRITLAFLPTPLAEAALREPWPRSCALRALLTGGDKLSQPPAQELPFRLVNHYGPTENTVVSTCADVPPRGVPPIGRPLPNTQAYVLDAHLQPVPVGVPGELLVGGVQLSPGYWNRPELTAVQFIQFFGKRLYRTGDRVRWLPDGNLEFLGRIDEQVKIRGFRIELGEIEAALTRQPGVREAVVVAREVHGDRRLVAYVVGKVDLETLRRALPSYMVPAHFLTLEALPLTEHGKVDRKALPAPERAATTAAGFVAPTTPTERSLAQLWQHVLRIERIGAKDNFFESGGHSLLAMQLVAGVRERFGVELPLKNLFERPVLADLAEVIDVRSWLARSKAPPARAAGREETLL